MKVTKEKTENSQAFLAIEMESAELEAPLETAYRRLVKKASIPGFRKGKAPRVILERYIGKDRLLEEALNDLLPQAYEQAIKEQGIETIAPPKIEIAQTDPVVFKAVVPLKPVVELGDYRHIQVTPQPVEVTENDINTVIEQLRHQRATWEPVERAVDFSDMVVLDVSGSIEGQSLINQHGAQYQVLRDSSSPAPGFAEQLIGMKRDEEKEFKLLFPQDHPRAELAGEEVLFKVKVTEIKQEKLPELNDEFAQAVNSDFKTLDSLREQVTNNLRLQAEERSRRDLEEGAIEAVLAVAHVEFPPVLVEREIDRLLEDYLRQLRLRSLDEYLKSGNKTEAELRQELQPLATKRVTRSLLLSKIAEEEKIEVAAAEVAAEIEQVTKETTEDKEKLQQFLNEPQPQDAIKQMLVARKTIRRLAEIAKGSDGEQAAST